MILIHLHAPFVIQLDYRRAHAQKFGGGASADVSERATAAGGLQFGSPSVSAMIGVLLVVFLAVSASALPVDPRAGGPHGVPDGHLPRPGGGPEAGGKLRRPRIPDTPGLDQDEYNRYWQEMVKENPGGTSYFSPKTLLNLHSKRLSRSSLPLAMLDHLKNMNPEQLAQLHPRVSERMARASEGVRNRLEEARRLNIDELRELQRLGTNNCNDTHYITSNRTTMLYGAPRERNWQRILLFS